MTKPPGRRAALFSTRLPGSPNLRIGLTLLALALGAVGCGLFGGEENPMSPSGPLPPGSNVRYAAVGASDVTGIGSSDPCLQLFADCPNSTGYVFNAARQLRAQGFTVTVSNLGIPSAVISRRLQTLGAESGQNPVANIIEQLAPFVPTDASLVTIFTGANDVNVIRAALSTPAGGTDINGFIDEQVRLFGEDYDTLLDIVRKRAGNARIIVLNLPNMGALPFMAARSTNQKRVAQRAAVGITKGINALVSDSLRVIDLMCDSRLYQPGIYAAPDDFHPNDAGYQIFADEVVRAATLATYPNPQASCSQMTLIQ